MAARVKVETFGQRLRRRREAAGLTLIDVEFELRQRLPRAMWVSSATLSRLENDRPSEGQADPFLVCVLSMIYGCKVSDLSTLVADELERLRDLLRAASRCTSPSADQLALGFAA